MFVVGDILTLGISLFLSLILRYVQVPNSDIVMLHIVPFSILFIFSLLTFFVFGMYEKQNLIEKKKIFPIIIQSQIINALFAVTFFYFSPLTQITPKTNLFIYLAVSVVFLSLWRIFVAKIFFKNKTLICLIGKGEDILSLKKDLEENIRGFEIVEFIDLAQNQENIDRKFLELKKIKLGYIVLDTKDPDITSYMPFLYDLVFTGVQFFEVSDLYESLYNKVPLQIVKHGWFLEHARSKPHPMYDFFKRTMDICIALSLISVSFFVYPLIFILIKLEDRGPLFYRDIRIGKDNKIITIFKFRSMTVGVVPELGRKIETRVGRFIRKTRIDEIPQLINILKGELSLIGPRPEQPRMVKEYSLSIPFYNVRHIIKPGLSGWAQIYHDNHPHHGLDIEATKEKLSYDLYYLKNRSVILDLIISLKTIKTLLLTKGK
jgi:lipopolysaccharide/colanic/teichoic acid biosynthesis glycosyltransferase